MKLVKTLVKLIAGIFLRLCPLIHWLIHQSVLTLQPLELFVAPIVLIQIGYTTQLIFTYSKSKIEPLQKDVKYDQS